MASSSKASKRPFRPTPELAGAGFGSAPAVPAICPISSRWLSRLFRHLYCVRRPRASPARGSSLRSCFHYNHWPYRDERATKQIPTADQRSGAVISRRQAGRQIRVMAKEEQRAQLRASAGSRDSGGTGACCRRLATVDLTHVDAPFPRHAHWLGRIVAPMSDVLLLLSWASSGVGGLRRAPRCLLRRCAHGTEP